MENENEKEMEREIEKEKEIKKENKREKDDFEAGGHWPPTFSTVYCAMRCHSERSTKCAVEESTHSDSPSVPRSFDSFHSLRMTGAGDLPVRL